MTDIALPAARARSRWRASTPATVDLLIVATITPDMAFPSTAALLADSARHAATPRPTTSRPAAPASCTRSPRRTRCSRRASPSARSSSAATCCRRSSTGPTARRSSSSATARARSCSSAPSEGGFLGFELGADGGGGAAAVAARERLAAVRGSRAVCEDERPRGVQVRHPRAGSLGAGDPGRVWADGGRRRRVRAAPGEHPDHRPRCREARHPRGEDGRQRRPLRQHLVGLDPARARRRVRTTAGCSRASSC